MCLFVCRTYKAFSQHTSCASSIERPQICARARTHETPRPTFFPLANSIMGAFTAEEQRLAEVRLIRTSLPLPALSYPAFGSVPRARAKRERESESTCLTRPSPPNAEPSPITAPADRGQHPPGLVHGQLGRGPAPAAQVSRLPSCTLDARARARAPSTHVAACAVSLLNAPPTHKRTSPFAPLLTPPPTTNPKPSPPIKQPPSPPKKKTQRAVLAGVPARAGRAVVAHGRARRLGGRRQAGGHPQGPRVLVHGACQ